MLLNITIDFETNQQTFGTILKYKRDKIVMWKLDLHFFLIVFFFFSLSDITDLLCQHLNNGSVAIIYFTNTEKFGRSTAASQYFLQMAGFLGIPVIAWNADNAGLESVLMFSLLWHFQPEYIYFCNNLQMGPPLAANFIALWACKWEIFGITYIFSNGQIP